MRADLHLHSTFSDGSDTPTELVDKAHSYGCDVIALTDHDSAEGIEEALLRSQSYAMTLIKGVEVSIPAKELGTFHVLVYLPFGGKSPLEERFGELRAQRQQRNENLVRSLRDAGIDITMEMVSAKAKEGNIARPHFAAVLVDCGVVTTIDEAFDRFLGDTSPFYIDKGGLSISELLDLTERSHAVASIAHPLTLRIEPNRLYEMLCDLKDQGLFGLESYYSRYRPAVREELASLAHKVGLVPTGGSDYHGKFKVGLNPGVGEGDLLIPDAPVYELLERLDVNFSALKDRACKS